MTLLPLAVLFLPIALGLPRLYPWARPGFADDAATRMKAHYLNASFFLIRTALYFAIWIGFAFLLRRLSVDQDRRNDHGPEPAGSSGSAGPDWPSCS